MLLRLKRTWKTDKSTIGIIYAYHDNDLENSIFRAFTLEDVERKEKIKGETAIPKGKYEVVRTWSPKFGKYVFMLKDVPNFERIYYHAGVEDDDTDGCILLGLIRRENRIERSQVAIAALYQLIDEALERDKNVWTIIE